MKKSIIIECQKRIKKIKFKEILYFVYQNERMLIETLNGSFVNCQSLKKIKKVLPEAFLKINRNVIINPYFVASVEKQQKKVLMINGREFSVSRRQMPRLKKYFKHIDS